MLLFLLGKRQMELLPPSLPILSHPIPVQVIFLFLRKGLSYGLCCCRCRSCCTAAGSMSLSTSELLDSIQTLAAEAEVRESPAQEHAGHRIRTSFQKMVVVPDCVCISNKTVHTSIDHIAVVKQRVISPVYISPLRLESRLLPQH